MVLNTRLPNTFLIDINTSGHVILSYLIHNPTLIQLPVTLLQLDDVFLFPFSILTRSQKLPTLQKRNYTFKSEIYF